MRRSEITLWRASQLTKRQPTSSAKSWARSEDLFATVCHLMGVDPEDEFLTPEGRPVKIVNNGRVLHDLL